MHLYKYSYCAEKCKQIEVILRHKEEEEKRSFSFPDDVK
jgi:hypothetical protein